jgi:tetratricopeptide (TPR) repeat protein
VLRRFKHRAEHADLHRMSTPSQPPSGRFRHATTSATSPQEQLRELLEDGERMYARYEELLRDAGNAGDLALVLELARIADEASDRQRAYAAQRLAAALLLAIGDAQPARDGAAWRTSYEHVVVLLVPVLERTPHEPELVLQLATALRELGAADLANLARSVVAELEPEHPELLREPVRRRPRAAGGSTVLDTFRDRIEVVLEAAARLEPRTISLCMIVRDEEEMLGDCLRSVAPHVDQLVVVDTGSTDRTMEIARSFGAEVHEFAWTGSFSEARNESLRHATGDWILWLDADERLVEADGPRLRELARRTWVEGFHVIETHYLGTGDDGTASHAPMRMFRRRPEHRWRGTVHEQVAWSLPGWLPGRMQHTTVRVDHFGYLAQVVHDRDKGRRNLELLLRQHETTPSAFTSYNIGSEHAGAGDWAEANAWLERALTEARAESPAGWTSQPWTPLMVQRATVARRLTGDRAGAIALASEGLTAWPDYTDLVWEQARSYADLGAWDRCEEAARAAIELGDAPARYVAVTGKGTFQARQLLARALREQGHVEEARAQLEAALREQPGYQAALADLVELVLGSGGDAAAVGEAVDAALGELRSSAPTANLLVGAALHEAGFLEEADSRYERVLASQPTHGPALVARAELRLAAREFERAWELAMQVDPLDRLAPAGAQSAFLAAAALGRGDLVVPAAERIAQAQSLPATERAVYVAWRQLIAPGEGVRALVPTDAVAREALLRNLQALALVHATDAFEVLHGLVDAVIPDAYERGMAMSGLYLRLAFPDMAGTELMALAERFGPDAAILAGLGKVATIKEMWEDAEVLLDESLQLDPTQAEARQLLDAVRDRRGA